MPISRKQNIRIAIKKSPESFSLDLKQGEIGTDGENLFVGQADRVIAIAPPIGSIIFWNRHGFGTTENGSPTFIPINLPRGWKMANGERIEDPNSPYNGYYLPNLTNDIFFMGANPTSIGQVGGTNDYNHKHNIAHHHIIPFSFSSIVAVGNHSHNYADLYTINTQAVEQGGSRNCDFGNFDLGKNTDPNAAHTHNLNSLPLGDQSSGLYVDSTNHMNMGNPRTYDDTEDFIDNRPRYLSGVFIIRVA